MCNLFKKACACALAAALTFGTVGTASAAVTSPTTSVVAVAKDDVAANVGSVKATVDTKEDGTAAMGKIAKTSKKSITVAASVTVDGVKYAVTTLDADVFKNCKKVTKVTLPASIKTINKNAFRGAKKIKTITLKATKSINVKKGAFKGLNTKKMTIKVSKKMSKKELKKFKKALKKAGFKGTVKKA